MMVAILNGRGQWSPALAVVLLSCLAAPARADEFQYLPDGTDFVFSVDARVALKSKTFAELKSLLVKNDGFQQGLKDFEKLAMKELTLETYVDLFSLVPVANIARYTTGLKQRDQIRAEKADHAEAQTMSLTSATQAYSIKHSKFPPTLAELLKKDEFGVVYLENKDALIDPWQQPFKYDPAGPKNLGSKPDIWTVTPEKVVIGNWPVKQKVDGEKIQSVEIYTTIKPVTIADLKAPRLGSIRGHYQYADVKVGANTLCVEYIDTGGQMKDVDKSFTKNAFCVIEGKYVLTGSAKELRAILERNKKPVLSPAMQTALKQLGSSPLFLASDQQAFTAAEKAEVFGYLGVWAGTLDGVQIVSLKVNETGANINVSAAFVCKDQDAAAEAKKAVDSDLGVAKRKLDGHLKNLKPDNPDDLKAIKQVRTLLDGVKVSTKGAKVTAEVSVDAASTVRILLGYFGIADQPSPKKEPEVKKTPIEKSTDSK